jgi:hypothetical protein
MNVVHLLAAPTEAPPIVIPLGSVEQACNALIQVEVAVDMAQGVLGKAVGGNDAAVLAGVRQVLGALSHLLDAGRALPE